MTRVQQYNVDRSILQSPGHDSRAHVGKAHMNQVRISQTLRNTLHLVHFPRVTWVGPTLICHSWMTINE